MSRHDTHTPIRLLLCVCVCVLPEFRLGTARYQAVYPFAAQAADELSFEEGEIVEVTSKFGFGEGWWRGRTQHGQGLVPAAYLEPMDSDC